MRFIYVKIVELQSCNIYSKLLWCTQNVGKTISDQVVENSNWQIDCESWVKDRKTNRA